MSKPIDWLVRIVLSKKCLLGKTTGTRSVYLQVHNLIGATIYLEIDSTKSLDCTILCLLVGTLQQCSMLLCLKQVEKVEKVGKVGTLINWWEFTKPCSNQSFTKNKRALILRVNQLRYGIWAVNQQKILAKSTPGCLRKSWER